MSIPNLRSIPLAEMLTMLNMNQLNEIRQALEVKGVSQLNKSDLIQRLSAEVINRLDYTLQRMDTERYRIIQSVMKAPNGILPVQKIDKNYDTLYFLQFGLLFLWNDQVVMPREIIKGIQELDQRRLQAVFKRNEQWIALTQGLLFYYGYLEIKQLITFVEEYTGEPVDSLAFFDVVLDLGDYDYSLKFDGVGVYHFMVSDPADLVAEQQMRSAVGYYPFPKADVLRASSFDYLDKHEGCQALISVLRKNWSMTVKEAEDFANHMAYSIQTGATINDLLTELQEQLEFDTMESVQELADAIVKFNNNTRLWILKGHAPLEVSASGKRSPNRQTGGRPGPVAPLVAPLAAAAMPAAAQSTADVYSFESKRKIGRNEPCPCGSGKKFKQCCGKSV